MPAPRGETFLQKAGDLKRDKPYRAIQKTLSIVQTYPSSVLIFGMSGPTWPGPAHVYGHNISINMSYSLNSFKGGYIADYIGDYYSGY